MAKAKKPKHVAIAGNIGAGKTTLTEMLSKHYRWIPQFEDVDHNPYLMDFYDDMTRWSFNLQIYFLHGRLNQILEIGGASEIPSIQKSSPISWEHINFIGRYDFKKKHLNFNIKKIAEKIMDSNRDKERAC